MYDIQWTNRCNKYKKISQESMKAYREIDTSLQARIDESAGETLQVTQTSNIT